VQLRLGVSGLFFQPTLYAHSIFCLLDQVKPENKPTMFAHEIKEMVAPFEVEGC
jgi:hypothetical protein